MMMAEVAAARPLETAAVLMAAAVLAAIATRPAHLALALNTQNMPDRLNQPAIVSMFKNANGRWKDRIECTWMFPQEQKIN